MSSNKLGTWPRTRLDILAREQDRDGFGPSCHICGETVLWVEYPDDRYIHEFRVTGACANCMQS